MSTIVETFCSEFTCPVCFELISPPIRGCRVGHVLCQTCFDRLYNCPICRDSLSKERNYLMEKLHEKFIFPCKFWEHGCKFMAKGPIVVKHQLYCPFATAICPFEFYFDCGWSGYSKNLFEHCEEQHSLFTRKGSRQTFTIKNLQKNICHTLIFNIIRAHGELFQLAICLMSDDTTRWRLITLGSEEDSQRFSCKIDFGRISEPISLNPSLNDQNEDLFSSGYWTDTPADLIKEVCEENDGDFIYNVRIIDKGLELFLNDVMHF